MRRHGEQLGWRVPCSACQTSSTRSLRASASTSTDSNSPVDLARQLILCLESVQDTTTPTRTALLKELIVSDVERWAKHLSFHSILQELLPPGSEVTCVTALSEDKVVNKAWRAVALHIHPDKVREMRWETKTRAEAMFKVVSAKHEAYCK